MNNRIKAIEQTAADWLVQREAGLSPEQEAALARWLAADAQHAQSYRALEQAWNQLDSLSGSALARELESELDEEFDRELAAAPSEPWWIVRWPWWARGAFAASLVMLFAYLAWWRPVPANVPYADQVTTTVGEVRSLLTPDGSTIRLNTDSVIEIVFTATERRVRLNRGEAFFQVAKNPARPFVVSSAGVEVRAVGTEFDVRLHSAALEVTVAEGRVRVDRGASGESLLEHAATPAVDGAKANPPLLAAGERVVIPVGATSVLAKTASRTNVAPVEIQRSLAWQDGRLVFESATLADMVAEFNRYNSKQLVIETSELGDRRFGGTFVASDTATFLDLLRETRDVVTEEQADRVVLRLR